MLLSAQNVYNLAKTMLRSLPTLPIDVLKHLKS